MLIWASLVRPDLQFSAKDHTRHLTSPSEWDWSHLEHTLRYIKGTLHYKFLISPRLPQGHSLPLRQLIPLHINTYCDSDWVADIESRKSTSGTVTSVLGVPLAFNSRTQSTVATSSAEAELYAIGLGISDSLHIYQLLQETSATSAENDLRLREHRDSVQPRQLPQHITIVDNIQITDPHLHRQYISTQPQQQAWPQQTVEAHRFEIPLRAGHPSYRPCEHPEGDIAQQSS